MTKLLVLWAAMRERVLPVSVVLVSGLIAYLGVGVWLNYPNQQPQISLEGESALALPQTNPFASADGTHLIAFVITASNCGWSTRPNTMKAMGSIRTQLRAEYGAAYAAVRVVGVALDRDLDAGLQFLSDIGEGQPGGAFDQVIVGGSWLNEQIVRFVWREGIAQAASPQVVVIERPVSTSSYLSTASIEVQNDRFLTNPAGSADIVQWIREGLPLDYESGSVPTTEGSM